ncbi:hypothetical protein BBOV_III003340 [Babesia bovis T2Bo]|uniref:Uncharacterized protein n=1 Tax=Babesia bovis TaxID=5865 RepID=A7AMW4_BABBO|nr:hypothetical protein BBOV_III003340 [Babesia bovis T2Bo]EDO07898.1 hypothetical protein BBOV_III003340 [Babesia bovis T2Bo]|eukprot:XP_001611466.1 hypothetical protein [Babesia bovis T2Bo]
MMDSESGSESKYYFDVTEKQWWVLPPGHSEWVVLPLDDAINLGLHDAVLESQCTFVESTVDEYKAAVSSVDESTLEVSGTECPVESVDDQCATVQDTAESSANQSLPDTVYDDIINPESLPSIQFGKSLDSFLIEGSCSPDDDSSRSEVPDGAPLRFTKTRLDLGDNLPDTLVHSQSDGKEYPVNWANMDSNSSVTNDSNAEMPAQSFSVADQLNSLIEDSSNRRSNVASSPDVIKHESFVRTAVRQATMRHATRNETGGLGDYIREVAAERERMQKEAAAPATEVPSGGRYERMKERARTLAAISVTHEDISARSMTSGEHRQSILRDLRNDVIGSEIDSNPEGVAFDVSSESEADSELVQQDSLQPLMSQRVSFRRGTTYSGFDPSG